MRILLVDDDKNKIKQISLFVSEILPYCDLSIKSSFQSGLKEIVLHPPDVLLLDMTMPNYDVTDREPGGRERRYAGKEILRQMQRRGLRVPVIIVTQYEQFEEDGRLFPLSELVAALRNEFTEFFTGAVFYQVANTEWMTELAELLKKVGTHRD
jgi:CheY-like chemotaxis protein